MTHLNEHISGASKEEERPKTVLDGPDESDLVTSVLQSMDLNSFDSGVGDEEKEKSPTVINDSHLLQAAKKASTWTDMTTGKSLGQRKDKSVKLAPKFQNAPNADKSGAETRPVRRQYGFVFAGVQEGAKIPHNYENDTPKINRLDFHGGVLPRRSPDEEFQRPIRFAEKRKVEYGKEITHETHRFLFTKQLWPPENNDYEIDNYRQRLPGGPNYRVNRVYDDPYQPDLAFKIQDKRRWNNVASTDFERHKTVSRSSRRRKSFAGSNVILHLNYVNLYF